MKKRHMSRWAPAPLFVLCTLTVSTKSLTTTSLTSELFSGLRAVAHVRRLRLHTRLPIVLPERIDAGFLALWSAVPLQKVVVVHANHAREIDASGIGLPLDGGDPSDGERFPLTVRRGAERDRDRERGEAPP